MSTVKPRRIAQKPQKPTTATTKSNVLAHFVEAVCEISQGVRAWEQFGADVTQWLKETKQTQAFEEWRQRRKA